MRNVNLAITTPIAAHSTASAISLVPISPLSSGPTSATGAGAPECAAGCADALGVSAGIDGRSEPRDGLGAPAGTVGNSKPTDGLGASAAINGNSEPTLPPVADVTDWTVTSGRDWPVNSGRDPGCRPATCDSGALDAGFEAALLDADLAAGPEVAFFDGDDADADTEGAFEAEADLDGDADLDGAGEAADFDGDGEAEVDGEGAAEADFDGDGEAEVDGEGAAEADFDGEAEVDGEGAAEADFDGEAELDGEGAAEADFDGDGDGDGEAEAGVNGDGAAEVDGEGAAEVDLDGEADAGFDVGGSVGVGVALGGIVAFGDADATAAGRDGLGLPMGLGVLTVPAVVPITTPNMHKPVARPVAADRGLRMPARLTPFLRSSAEGSLFLWYRHTMRYLWVVLAILSVIARVRRPGPARPFGPTAWARASARRTHDVTLGRAVRRTSCSTLRVSPLVPPDGDSGRREDGGSVPVAAHRRA